MTPLAKRLQAEIERQGLTARGVSLAARQSKNYVQSIYDAESENPTWQKIDAVANVLNVRTEWLLRGEYPRERNAGEPSPALELTENTDGLEQALASRWWEPDPRPSPIEAAQIAAEARDQRAKGAVGLHAYFWTDHLKDRWRQLRRPEKQVSPTIDTSDDLGDGKVERTRSKKRNR